MVNTKKIRKLMIAVFAFLICSILVVPVFAASTHDSGSGAVTVDNYMLDFSWETTYEQADASQSGDNNGGSGSVSLSSNVFTLAAKSSYYKGAGILNWTQDIVYNYTTRLTITNNGTKGCTVTYTTSGITEPSGSVTLGPGDAVSFTLATTTEKTSTKAQNLSGTVTITKVEAVSAMPIGFESSAYGSYSYAIGTDEAVTMAAGAASVSSNVESGTTITLTAGTPTNGYAFYGWMGAGKLLSTSNPYTHTASIETSIYPVFLPSDIIAAGAPFSVGDNSHMFWHLACADAVISGKPVVLAKDYTLPTNLNNNGLYEGHAYSAYITGEDGAINYIIPSGVTFLVPCDTANTVYTTVPGIEGPDTYSQPATYRTLTMASGAHITVNGAMSIAGYQGTKMPFNGCVSKSVGFVKMNSGSSITVNNGAFLYAWGYVTGSGSVTAKSGATVYESFQVTDWRGGNAASGMANNKQKVFPLSQYYIQNIEVPLTLEAGAKEYGYMTISYTGLLGGAETAGSPVPFVSSDGLFRISSGSLTKDYDEANDRIIFTITGNSSLASMSLSVKASLGITVNIKSANYVLPLNSNATVNCPSGSTITVTEDMALLPGVQVNIAEGGTVKLDKGVSMYIYDGDNWGNYIGSANLKLVTLPYAPGKASGVTRTEADLVDVKFRVDGILDASEGYLYTTAAGANIYSTGTGTVESNPGSETVTYQATQTSNEITAWPTIPITPALLKNSDGTYATTGASTVNPNTYTYTDGKWVCENHTYQMTSTTATCTQAGTSVYTCSVCGATKEEAQAALDHIDENTDHICDRNCGKTDMGTHEAAEGKHTCDYCGQTVTECADEDKDHDCDICGTAMGTHEAAEGKHTCDYCGQTVTQCADNDNDHNCDVCGTKLSDCADNDNNHKCDVCGDKLSDCADNDNNHKCDVCDKELSECADTDNDHNCDVCGTKLSDCADNDNDHNCDVCGAELRKCADNDNDHNCDVCGAELSKCADNDNDHKCDVCGTKLSDCADNDNDHNCDVCGEELSQCADDNSDHNCDICGEELSQCADTDNDHNCDVCGEELSECTDNNNDHNCDVCSAVLSECADEDKNHDCDICGTAMGTHEAAEGKHTCDYCGETVTQCADNDKDHDCDVCGDKLSDCADNDNDHNCDICGTKLSDCSDGEDADHKCDTCGKDNVSEHSYEAVVTAPTCTEKGYTTYTCTACGDSNVGDETAATGEHSYENGVCTGCGAAQTIAIDFLYTGKTLFLKGAVSINVYTAFEGEDFLTQEYILANGGVLFWNESDIPDNLNDAVFGTQSYIAEIAYDSYYEGHHEYLATSEGIPAKEYGDVLYFRSYMIVDGKYYYGELQEYGVKAYCEGRFENSTNTELKSALVALLNFGAEAQKYLDYREDALVNTDLQEYVDKGWITADMLEMNWNDNYLTALVEPSVDMTVNFKQTENFAEISRSLYLKGAISVNYYVTIGHDLGAFENATDVAMYFWTMEDYVKLREAGTPLSKENVSYIGEAVLEYSSKYGWEYFSSSEPIPAKNWGDTVYAVLCATDSNGEEHCTGIITYSPDQYANNKINDGKAAEIDALCQWMVIYSERASIYFDN